MANKIYLIKIFILFIFIWSCTSSSENKIQPQPMSLWYTSPAENWLEALPLGNGRLGAMVNGTINKEQLQLNEESLWAGKPEDPFPEKVGVHYAKFQQLNLEGKYKEALHYGMQHLAVSPTSIRSYEPLGNLDITFNHKAEAENYKRELNLNNGIVTINYSINGKRFIRESFISNTYNVIYHNFKSLDGEAINSRISFSRKKDIVQTISEDNILQINGQIFDDPNGYDDNPGGSGEGGLHMKFASQIAVLYKDGKLGKKDTTLTLENSTNFTVVVSATTDYNLAALNFDSTIDTQLNTAQILEAAMEVSYSEAKAQHIAEHSKMFNRVQLSLTDSLLDTIPTNVRLKNVSNGTNDNHLTTLFFQYGRYLLMGSSANRASLPSNLQGVWNKDMWAPWESDFHLNINLQMNYWPADLCNLSETFDPLSNYMVKLAEQGKTTAKNFIGSHGWMAHHVSNPFGRTTPSGSNKDSQLTNGYSFPLAGTWMSLSLWRHYEFTQDQDYLNTTAYPVLQGATQFVLDFLQENDAGELVTTPSYSPENAYIDPESGEKMRNTIAAAMDIQLIKDLFKACLESEKILGKNILTNKVRAALAKLPKTKIGANGTIQEWYFDYDEAEPGHRHMSHLYALYPSNQITPKTKELFTAAEKTIEKRLSYGGGQTGWSRAWVINFYARLLQGDKSLEHINQMMGHQLSPNMFDLIGKIFQIDGNLGATAGIAEMLLQSHEDGSIKLLPALPKEWSSGKVKGLKARGNYELDIEWENKNITKAVIRAHSGGKVSVFYKDKEWVVDLQKGEKQELFE
ncbi:glycoside hydrolase family 95 protein [Cellulophaga sp. F20128]|uniref:glycoside hydrolase family 95 protein n=1 Tax=Cellulophaga sp. F20128 TaxID=2926413 RepID=UPI001FF354AA|nr:glycoside hydrolase family 95 protein [Cellulophaga sp. F20128]MCK0157158.1 glycoside hydrolase family 95 protein [Cellulophaga sp. F20128]